MPRHISPTNQERTATAPYNFVPLPNCAYTLSDGINVDAQKISPWKMHDRFVPGTYSGWIDLSIKTLSPLYIRGPVTKVNDEWDKRDSRLRLEPFKAPNGRPAIPGSSLRGLIRTLVEILSFSKIKPLTNEKPFFRTVAPDRIGKAYRNRMIHGSQKPIGGYIRKNKDRWAIVPTKEVVRVHKRELNELELNVPEKPNPNYFPNWNGQHKSCWFKRDNLKKWVVREIALVENSSWEKGVLVLSGSAPNKKFEFVFIGEDETRLIPIPDRLWNRFHDDDQLTQWQERAFPRDQPIQNCRKAKGHLRDGEPVFFLTDDSTKTDENPEGLVFLGRAQMFRFPYDRSPSDLIPEEIKNANLDMAEAMFGKVSGKNDQKDQTIKGRVFFDEAVATNGGPEWSEEIIVPRILASPKVTCFQHYLTQNGTKSQKELTTYLKGDHTTIRGHKLYWHRWEETKGIDNVKINPLKAKEEGKEVIKSHDEIRYELLSPEGKDKFPQLTLLRPVKAGVTFSGRIRFENLTDIELGAMLSALRLPEGCAHKLGMGKPLGLGSVTIDSTLFLVDRAGRYACWENDGALENKGDEFIEAFTKAIFEHALKTKETLVENKTGLQKVARLDAFFHMLKWNEKPESFNTEYMALEKFKGRSILPTPHNVTSVREPAWQIDSPRPNQEESDLGNSESAKIAAQVIPSQQKTLPPPQTVKPIEKGQIRNGILKRSGDQWFALFEGDPREAIIINLDKIPQEVVDDLLAEFFITEQSKKGGVKARFEKLI